MSRKTATAVSEEKPRHERKNGSCELCDRDKYLTFHHLIPRKLHSKKRFRKTFTLREMQTRGLYLCGECHDGVHMLLTEMELGEHYNTKEALLGHEGVARHVAWARKQK